MTRDCAAAPLYANQYFNISSYLNASSYFEASGDYSGYVGTGYVFNTATCLKSTTAKYFCNLQNQNVFAINKVTEDNWNYGTNADSGTFGLNKNSPVWNILGSPATKLYDVLLTPFTDWSWAQAGYAPVTTQSILTIGGFASNGKKAGSGTTTISPSTSAG